jgi:hypothetical protein
VTVLDLTPTPAAELRTEWRNAEIKRRTAIVQAGIDARRQRKAAKKNPKPWFVIERKLEKRRNKKKPRPSIATLMFCDLNKVLHDNYGPKLPDDDAGREDVFIAVNLLIVLADGKMRARDLGPLSCALVRG